MALFDVPVRATKTEDLAIAQKAKKSKKSTTPKSGGLLGTIERIRHEVETNLGQYADKHIVIRDEESLKSYISHAIQNKVIAIDTETTGLDPMEDKLVGICIYTPDEKPAYIPVKHISYITKELIDNQLPKDILKAEFSRLEGIDIIMFNATFDTRILRHNLDLYLTCTWDCYVAAKLMDENLQDNALKELHRKYVLNGVGDAFKFDNLFKGITFDNVPINIAQLYAAHDAIITYELYIFQKRYLYYEKDKPLTDRNGMNGVSWVCENIEMPLIPIVADLEDAGIEIDLSVNEKLKDKYHKLLDDYESDFHKACEDYADDIAKYSIRHPNVLDNPINIKSSQQLCALLYEIIGFELPYDKKTKKPKASTDKDAMAQLDQDNPVVKAIIDYKAFATLVSTFIDKLPNTMKADGRIHCKFNQYGADTGRFSSSEPNLQNIPSHNKEIRQMFKAKDGYVLLSSDYSQQEPSCLAALCKEAGADALFNARFKGNDLYSEIASACFNMPYEECCEFDENGNKNPPEYKERRNQAKPILLGILYGRGDKSVAEQLNCTLEEAQQLKENLFRRFPEIKQFERDSLQMAESIGYVTTVCGRKRRLPDLQLPQYEFKWKDDKCPYDDPLDFTSVGSIPIPDEKQEYYLQKLKTVKFKYKQKVFEEANKDGIWIIDNGKKIADATRQCVNARIQGSAADLTKIAMIKLANNKRLKELKFKMLIPVHDEIIAECPKENAKECSQLLAQIMSDAAQEILHMPFSCDVECTYHWYGEKVAA